MGVALPDRTGLFGVSDRIALAVSALLLSVIVGAAVWLAARTNASVDEATRAQQISTLAADVLSAVQAAETGQRGRLLTGRDSYLAPYETAAARLPGLLDQLGAAVRDDPTDAPRFARLRPVVEAKLRELAATLQLERDGRHQDALALVLSDEGKRLMDQTRTLLREIVADQTRRLEADLERSRSGARLLVAVDSVALLAFVVLALFVARGANRYVARLREAQAALREANAELQAGRDRLEQAVRERTAELTAANEEVQRFAYIISHDLRAPLVNIIGFTSELEAATNTLNRYVHGRIAAGGAPVPDEVRVASEEDLPEAIRFIQASTAKMDRLINAILRLSREGRRVLIPERLDMNALAAGVVDSVRSLADAAGAEISVGKLPGIISDRTAVEQVFSNLVENAIKYLKPGRPGRVRIEGAPEGKMVRYVVADNGRGIAERDRERIFELFRRAGSQDVPGEGIGLAHVRALVRRLGGSIECHSVPDEGSEFVVRLPLVLAHQGVSA
jgi:signal transduction histidine kinase